MKRRSVSAPTTSASSTSTCGSAVARRASISACKLLIFPPFMTTKKRASARFGPAPAQGPALRSCGEEDSTVDPREAIESALAQSGARWRRVAGDEWGLTVPAAGSALHVGLALRGGMLAAQ